MDPLEERPNLFATDQFRIKTKGKVADRITCYDNVLEKFGLVFGDKNKLAKPENCTLIARPIEDMTADEWSKHWFCGEFGYDEWKDKNRYCSNKQMPFVAIEDFLSIGVYPFSQHHFGDTVIDTRTLTNA